MILGGMNSFWHNAFIIHGVPLLDAFLGAPGRERYFYTRIGRAELKVD